MAQFSVYCNTNPRTRTDIPFLLNVQNDLLDHLATRVVIPLAKVKSFSGPPSAVLHPIFKIGRERFILLTPMLAGILKRDLGAETGNLRRKSFEIIAALDVLITGV